MTELSNAEIEAMGRLGIKIESVVKAANCPPASSHICPGMCNYGWAGTVERIDGKGIEIRIRNTFDCQHCQGFPGRPSLPYIGQVIRRAWADILIGDRVGLAPPPVYIRP